MLRSGDPPVGNRNVIDARHAVTPVGKPDRGSAYEAVPRVDDSARILENLRPASPRHVCRIVSGMRSLFDIDGGTAVTERGYDASAPPGSATRPADRRGRCPRDP